MKEEVNNIIGFSFECGGYFDGYPKIEVNIVENKVLCIYNYPLKKKKKSFEISNIEWDEFLEEIVNINILTWKKNYNDPNIMDGTQWKVNINFQNGKKIEIHGNNDYPKEWDDFYEIVNKYFPIFSGKKNKLVTGKVYVVHNEWIQNPITGKMPYKIGITMSSIKRRYYGLGLKMPGEFVCDFAYEFGEEYSKVEKTLHDMLNQLNVNGEWFNVNESALDGIRNICELAGGKLITEKIIEEIIIETGNEINQDLRKIVDEWNKRLETKATGKSSKWRNILIPGINSGVHYQFRIKNIKEVVIQLGCWTKVYKSFDKLLKSFDGLEINGYLFEYIPPSTQRHKINGWKGKIRATLPKNKINDIVNTMAKFIELTKEKIINECNNK